MLSVHLTIHDAAAAEWITNFIKHKIFKICNDLLVRLIWRDLDQSGMAQISWSKEIQERFDWKRSDGSNQYAYQNGS